jgi:hypothetical protein
MKLFEFEQDPLFVESKYIANILTDEALSSKEFLQMTPEERKNYIQRKAKEYVDTTRY